VVWGHAMLGSTITQMRDNAARAARERAERRRRAQQQSPRPVVLVRSGEAKPTVLRPWPGVRAASARYGTGSARP
jgi:hypothetical protein